MINVGAAWFAGLALIVFALELAAQSFYDTAVIAVFFLAFFFLLPLSFLQIPDDNFLLGPVKRAVQRRLGR